MLMEFGDSDNDNYPAFNDTNYLYGFSSKMIYPLKNYFYFSSLGVKSFPR